MDYLASVIQTNEYLCQRVAPQPGDYFYLSLSDLLIALEKIRTDENIMLLDYGSGGSPYRSLFPNADYRRADFLQAENDSLDYVLNEESIVSEKDETFDLILSTQVAEHVKNPEVYFSECYRLLKPNVMLVCTTHGTFPDHGCPYDFQRWTADGLRRDIKQAGFKVEKVAKLTAGARAFFTVLDLSAAHLSFKSTSVLGLSFIIFSKIYQNRKAFIHSSLNKLCPEERMTNSDEDKYSIYVGLFAIGRK